MVESLPMLHVAIADGDDAVRTYTRLVLADAGFRVSVAATASEVRELLAGARGGPVDCLIAEEWLRVGNTFDAVEESRRCGFINHLRLVLYSNDPLVHAEAELREIDVAWILPKPCAPEQLIAAIGESTIAAAS